MNVIEKGIVFLTKRAFALVTRFFYEFLLLFILLVSATFLKQTYIIREFSYTVLFVFFACGVVWYYIFHAVNIKIRRTRTLALLFTAVPVLVFLLLVNAGYVWIPDQPVRHVTELNERIYGNMPTSFSQYIPFLYVIPPAVFWLLVTVYYIHPFAAMAVLYAVFLAFSASGLDPYLSSYTPYILFLFLSFWIYGSHMRRGTGDGSGGSGRGWIIFYSCGASLIIMLASSLLYGLFGSESYTERYRFIRNMTLHSSRYLYTLKDAGFAQEKGTLGGSVYPNNKTALLVLADRPHYLRGNAYTVYTGSSWEHTASHADSVKHYRKRKTPASHTDRIRITHVNLEVSSLFTPLRTNTVRTTFGLKRDMHGIYFASNKKRINDDYVVFVDENAPPVEEKEDIPHDLYRSLPKTVTQRTRELTARITSESDDAARSIQEHLTETYYYTTTVTNQTEYADFADSFLFEQKKGYCTHFATAAAVMLRIAGLESRYVEGFLMEENRNEAGVYTVTNSMAHAWAEYRKSPGDPWMILETVPLDMRDIPDTGYWVLRYMMEYENELQDGYFRDGMEEPVKRRKLPRFPLPKVFPFGTVPETAVLLTVTAGLIGTVWLILTLRNMVRRHLLFQKRSTAPLYRFVRIRLERFGYCRSRCQTLNELAQGIHERELKFPLERLFTAYQYETYGGVSVGGFTRRDLTQIQHFLKKKNRLLYTLLFFIW